MAYARSVQSSMLVALALAFVGGAPTQVVAQHQPDDRHPDRADPAPWSRFRGVNGQGLGRAHHTGYPLRIAPTSDDDLGSIGPAWRTEVGRGHSSVCVHGNALFVTAEDGEDRVAVLGLDRATGAVVWRVVHEPTEAGPERTHRVNSRATPTPTSDGERVFVHFGSLGVICHDAETGDIVWQRDYGAPDNRFGTASSPVLVDDLLIVSRDTEKRSVLDALRPATGEVVWSQERDGGASWSTPVVRTAADGERELLVYGTFRLTAHAVADGGERWSVPGLADEPCITPAISDDGTVFVTSYNMRTNTEVTGLPEWSKLLEQLDGDGDGRIDPDEAAKNESVLSRMDADGEGDHPLRIFFRFLDRDRDGLLTETEWQRLAEWLGSFEHRNALVAIHPPSEAGGEAGIHWQYPRGVPECPSPLLLGTRILLVKNGGMATCLDAGSGELVFQQRIGAGGPYYASPVAAPADDGPVVYTASARGVVTALRAGSELDVLWQHDFGERILATPALVDGWIYLRTESALYAFPPDS